MKKKHLLSFLVPVAVALLTLVGCSDYDNDFGSFDYEYKKGFVEAFGEIDEEQDWNLAERSTVTVTTSSAKDIKIYSEEEGTYTLLANYRGISGTETLSFDILEGVKTIIVSNGETALRSFVGGSVSFDDMTSSAGEELDTRQENVNRNEWAAQYVLPGNVTQSEIAKVKAAFSQPHYGAVNTIYLPWNEMWVQHVYKGESTYLNGFLKNIGVASDQMNHLLIYNKGNKTEEGDGLPNFEHINDFNSGKQNANYSDELNNIIGTTLMHSINPEGCPTEQVTTVTGETVTQVKQFAYHNTQDSKYHFEYIYKVVDGNLYIGFDFYAHGTDNQPTNKNMDVERDWIFNDWIIKVSKAVSKSGVTQSVLQSAKANAWILAAEDMGSTDDIDYNDVVVKVQHTAGNNYLTVTPLAAGGTLASYLYFNDECIGEIHQLMGAAPAISGQYPVLNVGATSAKGSRVTVYNVNANWSLSCYSVTDWDTSSQGSRNMGGFTIRVLPSGTPAADKKLPIGSSLFGSSKTSIIQGPNPGDAPYILCVPFSYQKGNTPSAGKKTTYTWAWPNERRYIVNAYTAFGGWVNNHNSNKDWYTQPNSSYVFNTAAAGAPEEVQPVEETMTSEEVAATNEAYANIVQVKEYASQSAPEGILKLKDGITTINVDVNQVFDILDYIDTNYPVYCTSSSEGEVKNVNGSQTVMQSFIADKQTVITIQQQAIDHKTIQVTVVTGNSVSPQKPEASISLSDNSSMEEGSTKTVTINTNSTGAISASTQNGGIFNVSVNNKTLSITALQAGNDNIIIHQEADDNYAETYAYFSMTATEKAGNPEEGPQDNNISLDGATLLSRTKRGEYALDIEDGSISGTYNVRYNGNIIKSNVTSLTLIWRGNYVNYGGPDIEKSTAMRSNGGEYNSTIGTTKDGSYIIYNLNKFQPYQARTIYVYATDGSTMYLYVK